jgi:hypothetical protein
MAIFDSEFVRVRYDFELRRKDDITNALTMPITVVSGVGGVLVAMARSFTYRGSLTWWGFVPLVVADVVSLFFCLVSLARAYHLQTYVYLPLLKDLDDAKEAFQEFNQYIESTGGEVDETFEGDLRRRIIEAADANTQTNEKRTETLRVARLWLFAVLWLTALAGIPYVFDQILQK